MSSADGRPRTVFITYAQDSPAHMDDVRKLADLLRFCGVDAEIDQYAEEERRDWYAWAHSQFTAADYVIVVASPAMGAVGDGVAPADRNRGVQAEMLVLRDYLHRDRPKWTKKILPVVLPGETLDGLPDFVAPYSLSHYLVDDLTPGGVDALLRVITGQPKVVRLPVGKVPRLPPTRTGRRRGNRVLMAVLAVCVLGASAAVALIVLTNGEDPSRGGESTVEAGAGDDTAAEPDRVPFECNTWITSEPRKPNDDRAELDPRCGCELGPCDEDGDVFMTDEGLAAGPSARVVLLDSGTASWATCRDRMTDLESTSAVVPRERLRQKAQLCVTTDEDNLVAVHVTETGNASINVDYETWAD